MFERFSDRARKIMALAHQEALRLDHDFIGTEHILLGILAERGCVGASVLQNLGVDLSKARKAVEKLLRAGPRPRSHGELEQTPRTKRVIQLANEEARALNHTHVGSEHLLLGLIREEHGVAAQVLVSFGLELES